MNKRELWLRIRNYHFDHLATPNIWEKLHQTFGGLDASEKAFADKISRKHSWTKRFTLKAVREYKKFIYLGVVSGFPVTPSKIIDVVWHEHILFTNAYHEFCDDVIQYRFEHYPELFPVIAQTEKFNSQYIKTLELYFLEFGILPPADVWEVTKFDKEEVSNGSYSLQRRKKDSDLNFYNSSYGSELVLAESFTTNEISQGSMSEFGGGDFGGGGANGTWDGGGDSGGDSGGDGGSGCSSGCGGGD